jgi:ribonuclease Y
MAPIGFAVIALASAGLTVVLAVARGRRRARELLGRARAEAAAAVSSARIEAAVARRASENESREAALALRAAAQREAAQQSEQLAARRERLAQREEGLRLRRRSLDDKQGAVDARHGVIRSLRDGASGLRRDAARLREEARRLLEERAGQGSEAVMQSLVEHWVEQARADAAQTVRSVEQTAGDQDAARHARRFMEIAVSRYHNHFLTERPISNVPIGEGVAEALTAADGLLLRQLEQAANVTMHVADDGSAVKLEGLDGVGREIARRALSRLSRRAATMAEVTADPDGWVERIKTNLESEIQGLGRKAFTVLGLPRAHPEIVTLVGKLNYRTSYTQNQWLHAVEASFLAGMMAAEMELDVALARRATLLHDIGKALTHEIDGSHAVIGADIARRLGEPEIVANAIGAHHADEPPSSVYAYLVAAADAMSGARPGARRELADMHSSRLQDLERIGHGHRGVERAFAVHGGRELRVYVRESEVDDLRAVEMSGQIAEQIAEELTFPGQIKVTVIRSYEAVSVAH